MALINVTVISECSMFGHFLKFIVTKQIVDPLPSRCAVDVLMSAQRADSSGRKFVSVLVDCLWYIDGRIHVFEKQGYKLPDFVSSFKGYNKPELSK